jgi:hypothetical protein
MIFILSTRRISSSDALERMGPKLLLERRAQRLRTCMEQALKTKMRSGARNALMRE